MGLNVDAARTNRQTKSSMRFMCPLITASLRVMAPTMWRKEGLRPFAPMPEFTCQIARLQVQQFSWRALVSSAGPAVVPVC